MHDRLRRQWEERERAREEGMRNLATWRASREQRAEADRREVRELWGPICDRSDSREELELHAERIGALNRMVDLSATVGDTTLRPRVQSVIDVENLRHTQVMDQIRLSAGVAQ